MTWDIILLFLNELWGLYPLNTWLLFFILFSQLTMMVTLLVIYFKTRRKLRDMWERIKIFGQNLAGVMELDA